MLGVVGIFALASCSANITKGEQGPKGDKGDTGETGPTGPTGPKGENGSNGTDGTNGSDGHSPIVTIGDNGNWFIDGTDSEVYAGEKKKKDTSTNTIKEFDSYSLAYADPTNPDITTAQLLSEEKQTVLFNSDLPGIPFVNVSEFVEFMGFLATQPGNKTIVPTFEKVNGIWKYISTLTSGVKSEAYFDAENQLLITHNINSLVANDSQISPLVSPVLGKVSTYDDNTFQYFNFYSDILIGGKYTVTDLSEYENIKIVEYDNKLFIPFQTLNDLFDINMNLYYNGQAVYTAIGEQLVYQGDTSLQYTVMGTALSSYLDNLTTTEKETLYKFSYDELCLLLDLKYGLRDTHKVSSADEFLSRTTVKERMLAGEEAQAIAELVGKYMEDNGHTNFTHAGFTQDLTATYARASKSDTIYKAKMDEYNGARAMFGLIDAQGEILKPVKVIGNTMYIMFDEFKIGTLDHYEHNQIASFVDTAPDLLGPEEIDILNSDLLYLISYSVQYANSTDTIDNIVLDLSCNGGGKLDSALFVIGAMLGDDAFAYFQNPNESSSSLIKFKADVNLDGKYDENDYFNDKNLYCLTSELSFSCGNLLPAIFKSSEKVTLIGQQTAGGSCIVHNCTTARGTAFSISSTCRMYIYKNGAGLDVEFGVTPNVYLDKITDFYDRGSGTSKLKSIYIA